MSVRRYLDPIEAQYLGTGGPIAAFCQGHVDELVMSRAFGLLCRRYPVLRARVRADDRGHLLYVPPDHPEVAVTGDYRNFQDVITYARETSDSWDPAYACSKVAVFRAENRASVVFDIDHGATADGRARNALFAELWRLYTDLVNGVDVSVQEGSLPASPYELLQRAMGDKQHSLQITNGGLPVDSQLPPGDPPLRKWICLTKNDTHKLIAASKANGVSIHGLMSGAILMAQRSQASHGGRRTSMVLWSVVDLRNRIGAPVGETETRDFIGLHKASVTVAEDSTPISIGHEIKSQLRVALKRHELFNPVIGRPPVVLGSLEQRFANAYVNSLGIIPTFAQPAELTINSIRIVPPRAGFLPGYGAFTYDGKLNIYLLFPRRIFAQNEVEQIGEEIATQLIRATTMQPSGSFPT